MKHAAALTRFAVLGLAFAFGIHSEARAASDAKLSANDRSFITQATNGGMAEVEFSKIAMQSGGSSEVKAYAKRLVDDHMKAGMALEAIAAKLGATPPKPPAQQPGDLKRFAELSGEKLDKAYIERMVRDHKGTIALFEKQAKSADAPELKDFATKTLPTLKEHLKMAMALAEKGK